MRGAVHGLMPGVLAAVVWYLGRAFGVDWAGVTPPAQAMVRTLPGVLAFWGWRDDELFSWYSLPLYGAFAGAVVAADGLPGAAVGLVAGAVAYLFLSWSRRLRGFWARYALTLAFAVLTAALGTMVLVWLGLATGWVLPLVVLLSGPLLDSAQRKD